MKVRFEERGKGNELGIEGFCFHWSTGVESKQDFDYWIGLALDFNKKAKASKKKK